MRLIFLAALLSPTLVLAQECCVLHPVPEQGETIAWNGQCRDGLAEGQGVLTRTRSGKPAMRYEVTLARGEIAGEGMLKGDNGFVYAGTFKDGLPHGPGFIRFPNGASYEGEVARGVPEGVGTWTGADGSRYQGQFKAGKKQGRGRIEYALGGSYEGQWMGDAWHGQGVLTFAGSGRKLEGQFDRGQLPGEPRAEAPAAPSQRYTMKEDAARTGTNIRREMVVAAVPPDKGWAELTPEQQAVIRRQYAALAPDDAPPYPLKGTKELYAAIGKAMSRIDGSGDLRLLVKVGADGAAESVTAIGAPSPELVRFASMAVMLQKYKPAVCDGQPCAMVWPVSFSLSRTN